MTTEFPRAFDPTRCILFLGSGFSREATNRIGTYPPVGDELRKQIIKEINKPDIDDELKDVSHYAQSLGFDLHGLLNNLFVISKISDDQKNILRQDWKRIYTTNYDDCIERNEIGVDTQRRRKSFSFEDPRPAKIRSGSIIHLHGYIHNCKKDNVLSQLILDHKSYAEQETKDSPWWEQFSRDLRGAQHIFFVGYSMSDFPVASYLTKNPSYTNKTHFIVRGPVSDIVASRLSMYGSIHPIAVSGFSAECNFAVPGCPIRDLNDLQSFRYMDPYKDNKFTQKPTPLEIDALLTRGKVNQQILSANYSTNTYSIPRRPKIGEASEKIENSATLIIHSRTANGKSLFSELLAMEMYTKGYTCVRFKGHTTVTDQEVDFLSTIPKLCIFISTYDDAVSIVEAIQVLSEKAKFIIEINTGTDQIRRTEIQGVFPKPIQRVDLNQISSSDVDDFIQLLDEAGIPVIAPSDRYRNYELRDVLLKIIESPFVSEKLDVALKPLVKNSMAKRVVAVTSVLKALGVNIGIDFLRAVVKTDPYDALLSINEKASEFASFSEDYISPHSAVFSEFFLNKYVGGEGISAVLYRLAVEAAKRVNSPDSPNSQRKREARRALGALLQYKNIEEILGSYKNRDELISDLYENLRDNININNEPLFWLQYSIFMQAAGEYPIAKKHMRAAYERASHLPGFLTYQLDTNYLKLLLQLPKEFEILDDELEEVFNLLQSVRNMITAEDHRLHAFRVLEDIEGFSLIRGPYLSHGERQRLSIICFGIIKDLDSLPLSDQMEFGTVTTKKKVEAAVSALAEQG